MIYLNTTFFKLLKNNYTHNCLYLALEPGGLSYIRLQDLILSVRNRHVHKCHLEHVCNTLEIHIELISITPDGLSRIEHYGKYFDETYNLGLVKGHYFINDYTELTSYCLYNYEESKDITYCNNIYNKFNDKSKRGNDIFIKAFQVCKVLIDKVDKLTTPMELTYWFTKFHRIFGTSLA